jgi:hypothetical protein
MSSPIKPAGSLPPFSTIITKFSSSFYSFADMRQPPPPTSGKGSSESASVTSTDVCRTEAGKDSLHLAVGCRIEG